MHIHQLKPEVKVDKSLCQVTVLTAMSLLLVMVGMMKLLLDTSKMNMTQTKVDAEGIHLHNNPGWVGGSQKIVAEVGAPASPWPMATQLHPLHQRHPHSLSSCSASNFVRHVLRSQSSFTRADTRAFSATLQKIHVTIYQY